MKEKVKILISSILLILMVFSCDMLPFGDDDDKKDDQQEQPDPDPDPDPVIQLSTLVEGVVDDFMGTLTSLSGGSRSIDVVSALNQTQLDLIEEDIYENLDSSGLNNSTNLGTIISAITESAQLSLSDQGDTVDKIDNLGAIAKASMAAVGLNKNEVSFAVNEAVLEEIIGDVSEVLVENITAMGIGATDMVTATKAAVGTVVASLDSVEIDSTNVSTFVQAVSNRSSVALAGNQGMTENILKEALAATSTSAIDAIEFLKEDISLDDTLRGELTKDISGAVSASLNELEAQLAVNNVTIVIEVTVIVNHITVESIDKAVAIQQIVHAADEVDESFITDMKTDIIAGSVESLLTIADETEKDQLLQDFENSIIAVSDQLGITEDDLNQAIIQGEVDATPIDNLTTAQKLEHAKKQLRVGSWSGARDLIFALVENDAVEPVPDETYLWWAALKIAHITVSSEMRALAADLGLVEYPTTMEGLFSREFTEGQKITEINWDYQDEYGNPEIFTHFLPAISGYENFIGMNEEEGMEPALSMDEYFLTLVSNLIANYGTGLNGFYDTLLQASDVMDEVTAKLRTLDENLSIALDFAMFNDIAYSTGSGWPEAEVIVPGEAAGPEPINIGKAEITVLGSIFEVLRMAGHMGQAVSLAGDLTGYWGAFNPIDGIAYSYSNTGYINGMNSEFNWATLESPFSDGLMHARTDAEAIMAEANQHFINFLSDIRSASESIAARDVNSEFFVSPATTELAGAWETVVTVQSMTSILLTKVIASLQAPVDDSVPVYFPQLSLDSDPFALIEYYGVEGNWPDSTDTSAIPVNFSMFKKPFHALDNLIHVKTNGEPEIYVMGDTIHRLATTTDYANMTPDTVFYVKLLDVTLGGMAPQMAGLLGEFLPPDIVVQDDNSMFIPLPGDIYGLLGHAIYTAGTNFIYDGESFESTGSFFTGLLQAEMDFVEVVVLTSHFSHEQYQLLEEFEDNYEGIEVRVEHPNEYYGWEIPYSDALNNYLNDLATENTDVAHIVLSDNGEEISQILLAHGELQDQISYIDTTLFEAEAVATTTINESTGLWAVPIGKEFYSVLFVKNGQPTPDSLTTLTNLRTATSKPIIHLVDDWEIGPLETLYSSVLTRYATADYIENTYTSSANFTDAQHTSTMNIISTMNTNGLFINTAYFVEEFRNGELPYILGPSYYYGKLKWGMYDYYTDYDGFNEFYMTLMPSLPSEVNTGTTNGRYLEGYAILKSALDPAKTTTRVTEAAKEVLKFLVGEEMSRVRADEMGVIPVFKYDTNYQIGMGIDELAALPVIPTATDNLNDADRETLKGLMDTALNNVDVIEFEGQTEDAENPLEKPDELNTTVNLPLEGTVWQFVDSNDPYMEMASDSNEDGFVDSFFTIYIVFDGENATFYERYVSTLDDYSEFTYSVDSYIATGSEATVGEETVSYSISGNQMFVHDGERTMIFQANSTVDLSKATLQVEDTTSGESTSDDPATQTVSGRSIF